MPVVSDPYIILPPDPNPDGASAFPEIYEAKSKTAFLTSMVSSLRALGLRLYPTRRGSVAHRFLDTVALELSLISRAIQDVVVRAVLQSGYIAYGFTPAEATFATGTFVFTRRSPAPSLENIPAGTILSSVNGRTAVTLVAINIAQGGTTVTVAIRAESPGAVGNAAPGEYQNILSPLPGNYIGTNPTPLSGGVDRENAIQTFSRFQKFLTGKRIGTAPNIESQCVVVTAGATTVRKIAVVQPWRVPQLNMPPGTFYVAVESGGGIATQPLVDAVQARLSDGTIVAAGNLGIAVSSSPLAFNLSVAYRIASGANVAVVAGNILSVWNGLLDDSAIEDGSGRGEVDTASVISQLFGADPAITELNASSSPPATLKPPVAGVVTIGALTATLLT